MATLPVEIWEMIALSLPPTQLPRLLRVHPHVRASLLTSPECRRLLWLADPPASQPPTPADDLNPFLAGITTFCTAHALVPGMPSKVYRLHILALGADKKRWIVRLNSELPVTIDTRAWERDLPPALLRYPIFEAKRLVPGGLQDGMVVLNGGSESREVTMRIDGKFAGHLDGRVTMGDVLARLKEFELVKAWRLEGLWFE